MTSPITLLEENQKEREYLQDTSNAEVFFEEQVDAIKSIKDTRGYKEIVRYWQREWEAKVIKAGSLQSNEIADYKAIHAEIALCQRFLDFLEMMK
jgi:hypothetical protein